MENRIQTKDTNTIKIICYLLPPITGIIFFVLEKHERVVKYHAMQSILIGILFMILNFLQNFLLYIPFGPLFSMVIGLATFAFWLTLLYKAYLGEDYAIPYISTLANDILDKK